MCWMSVMDSAAVCCMIRSSHIQGVKIALSLMFHELPSWKYAQVSYFYLVVSSVLGILQSPCLKSPLWIYCWRGKRWSMGRLRKGRGFFIFTGNICSSPSNEGCRNWLLRAATWLDVWVWFYIMWCLPLVPGENLPYTVEERCWEIFPVNSMSFTFF